MFQYQHLVQEMDGLRGFAWRLARNTHDAEDLLQSTMLKAMEKEHLFEEGTDLFKWTSKIMYNQFVSGYRRRIKFESQYDPQPYIDKQSTDAEQLDKVQLHETSDAMQLLSKEHREICYLICVEGMRYEDVANQLNIPVGTVRSRLSRARERLRIAMESVRPSPSRKIH